MKTVQQLLLMGACILCAVSAQAASIDLKNGDKVTGDIVSETDTYIVINTQAMGQITIDKDFVKVPVPEPEVKWTKKASIGYTQSRGNTEKSSGNVEVNIKRKTSDDELHLKWSAYIASNDGRQDAREFYSLLRYDQKINDKWFRFIKGEVEQDRYSNIDYRVSPGAGVGYWFINEADTKLKAEVAAGLDYTNYRDGTESDSEAVLIPRAYFEKKLYDKVTFTEDVTLYPSLEETSDYRLRSETAFVYPMSEQLAWKLSLINELDSDPSGTSKKHDKRVVTSIDMNF